MTCKCQPYAIIISECENLIAVRFIHLFVRPYGVPRQDRQLRDKLDAEKQQDAFQKQKELQILGTAAAIAIQRDA